MLESYRPREFGSDRSSVGFDRISVGFDRISLILDHATGVRRTMRCRKNTDDVGSARALVRASECSADARRRMLLR